MCGRTLIGESKAMAAKAGVILGGEAKEKDTNRPPGTDMPIILDARPGKLHYVKWGLIPSGSKEVPKFATTYCRIETMHSLPSYRELIGHRHCVFVVEGFYEWDRNSKVKQPYFFERVDKGIMLLAGFWDSWKDPKTAIVIPSCTMIMQPANAFMSKIHDRMPCLLSQSESAIWLDRELPASERLKVLHPVDDYILKGWQVDSKLNNARNKDEDNNKPSGPDLSLFN
ncbi:SOS response-associated peptidase [Pedobacter jeongneungensis]|uniref:SOS response-associated peptidase n=1 Tax=Pedobacter jeongneungensis TaxID=947309 RepID=UPI0009FE91DE|nr:SOS response-associated peptidase [Pedobacter jeongneungensis]